MQEKAGNKTKYLSSPTFHKHVTSSKRVGPECTYHFTMYLERKFFVFVSKIHAFSVGKREP